MRILITGADGQLGRDLLDCLAGRVPAGGRRCALLGPEGPRPGLRHEVLGTDIGTMRVDDRDAVLTTFTSFRPELVLHGGAFTAVERCETEVDAAYAVNAIGARHIAEAAALVGAHVVMSEVLCVPPPIAAVPTAPALGATATNRSEASHASR